MSRHEDILYSQAWMSGFVSGVIVSFAVVGVGILAFLGWVHG